MAVKSFTLEKKVNKMKIPFGTITVTEKSIEIINEIFQTNRFSSGKYVRLFEKKFAELTGVSESVAVSTGTDAVALACAVLYDYGAKRDDEIIVPALSFVATGNAILQAGFKPVFVDVERETLNIDVTQIEEKITEKTKAIIPVHLMGKPAEMDTILEIARKYNLLVIEDAAEAHGAVYKGKNVGSIGDMGAFSLYIAHIISTIEGGIITANNPEHAEILRSLRSHGRACKCETCVVNTKLADCEKRFKYGEQTDIRFVFERVGFSSKMNELEAAVGIGNLDLYDTILSKRRKNLYYLLEKLKEFDDFIFSIMKDGHDEIGPHALPILVRENAPFNRNELGDYLRKNGIDYRTLFSSMPTQCEGYKYLGHTLGDFPNAEYIGNYGIHTGVHQDIDKEGCDYILDTIRNFIKENS